MARSTSKAKSAPAGDAQSDTAKKTEPAKWTVADETAFIAFLYDHRSAGGDGATFKAPTFNEVAPLLDAMKTEGGTKTGSTCSNK